MSQVEDNVPQHVGLILDGNRRWARDRGLSPMEGHRKGSENFGDAVKQLFNSGVSYVSAFVFSTENWKRTEEEVSYLMNLVIKLTTDRLNEFDEAGIRIVILGSRERLSKKVLKAVNRAEDSTAENQQGTLALCFNYGGQQELVDAYKELVREGVAAEDITAETIQSHLYWPEVPDVDLIVRTSGEQRLSGFMLWRSTYAELLFLDKYWPAVTNDDMDMVLEEFAARQRRYGA